MLIQNGSPVARSRLNLTNCVLAPDVWDLTKVAALASQPGYLCDVTLLLSVVHHIDNVSLDQYAAKGLSRVEASWLVPKSLLSRRSFL
eukprot:g19500.t1